MKYENYDHKNLTWKRKQAMETRRMFPARKMLEAAARGMFSILRVWTLKITLPVMRQEYLVSPLAKEDVPAPDGVISPDVTSPALR